MHSEVSHVMACVARSLVVALAALVLAAPELHAQPLQLRDALEQALSRNPDIAVARTGVEAARGQQQQAAGQFDWNLYAGMSYQKLVTPLTDSAAAANDGIEQTRVYTTGYQAGVSRQLRSGVLLDANVDTLGEDDRTAPPWLPQQNLSRLNLTLTLPLLRGRGERAVGAAEDAARLAVEARRYTLLDSAARTLYGTLVAYWEYRARIELEKVAISSEERSISLLNSIQKLVDASERPPADLVLLRADQADKAAARAGAALARIDARQALGRLLGLDAEAIANLPEPLEMLPDVAAIPAALAARPGDMAAAAMARRPDLRALALQGQAAQRLLAGSTDQLKPRLDVDVGVTQARAGEGGGRYGMLRHPGRRQSEPSLFAKLNFEFPVGNNLAKGAVREYAAEAARLEIEQRDLGIAVATGVDNAWQALTTSAAQLKVAREGLSLYEKAVSQEITKQRNGIATLIDVINTESRFVSARMNYLQIQLAYATALARLRLETGTLVPPVAAGDDSVAIETGDMTGLGPLAAPHPPTR